MDKILDKWALSFSRRLEPSVDLCKVLVCIIIKSHWLVFVTKPVFWVMSSRVTQHVHNGGIHVMMIMNDNQVIGYSFVGCKGGDGIWIKEQHGSKGWAVSAIVIRDGLASEVNHNVMLHIHKRHDRNDGN